MWLHTDIPPRKDGTVTVAGLDGKTYEFTPDDYGQMTGLVDHKPTVAVLIASHQFWPVDDSDFDDAMSMTQQSGDGAGAGAGAGDGDGDGAGAALPVELNTPPSRRKPGPKAKK